MKKGLLITILLVAIVFVTACGSKGSKSTRTVEDLLDEYVEAYTKADVELAKDIFPPFYIEYAKNMLTKDRLEAALESAKEPYGDDFHITYEIKSKTKMTEEELKAVNDRMASRYNSKDDASECYKFTGTITFVGSKFEDPDPIDSMIYCNYSGAWYLVGY